MSAGHNFYSSYYCYYLKCSDDIAVKIVKGNFIQSSLYIMVDNVIVNVEM